MKFRFAYVAFLGLCLFGCHNDSSIDAASVSADCLVKAATTNGTAIVGTYIVTYQPTQSLPTAPNARIAATEVLAEHLLTSYAVADPTAQVLAVDEQTTFLVHLSESESEKLRQDPSVVLIVSKQLTRC